MLGHDRFIVARLLRKSSLAHLTNTHSHTHSLSLSHHHPHALSLSLSHTCGVYVSVYDKRFLPNDIESESNAIETKQLRLKL